MKSHKKFAVLAALALGLVSSAHALDITVSGSDSTAIQRAIDQVAAGGGGTVYLPARTYMMNARLNMKSGVRVDGAGNTSLLRGPNSSYTHTIFELGNLAGATIRDVKIDGWGGGQQIGMGIHVGGGSGNSIINVNITNYKGNGMNGSNSSNLVVTNCYIDRCGGGYNHNSYFRDLKTASFTGTTSINSGACGMKWGGTPSDRITVSGNMLRFNSGGGMVMQDNQTNNVVRGNNCNDNATYGMALAGVNLMVDGNITNYNNRAGNGIGILTWGGSGTVKNHSAGWNYLRNYDLHGAFIQTNNR